MKLKPEDLKTESRPPRPSSAGGQHVGPGPIGVKITHVPTGLYVISEHERSQHMNRDKALRELDALVIAHEAGDGKGGGA